MSVAVRRAVEGDAAGLNALYPHWGIERCIKRIKGSAGSKKQLRLVAVLDGKIVGHLCVKMGQLHHAHLSTFYSLITDPSERGKGIAKQLFLKGIELLPAEAEFLLLQVQSDNEPAKAMFSKLGFKEYGLLPDAFKRNGEYKDNILMYRAKSLE